MKIAYIHEHNRISLNQQPFILLYYNIAIYGPWWKRPHTQCFWCGQIHYEGEWKGVLPCERLWAVRRVPYRAQKSCYAMPHPNKATSILGISTRVLKPSHCAYHWFSHSSKTTLAAKPDSVAADALQPVILYSVAEGIEWFIENQAFSPSYYVAPPPPPPPPLVTRPATHKKTEKGRQLPDVRRGRGWERSQIICWRESLNKSKSFNHLCFIQISWPRKVFQHIIYTVVYSAGIFKQSIGARNRVGIGLSIPAWRNWFLGIDFWVPEKFKNSGPVFFLEHVYNTYAIFFLSR